MRKLYLFIALLLATSFTVAGQGYETLQEADSMITTTVSTSKANQKDFAIEAVATVNTPSAKAFTCVAATDVCTAASHGFITGLKGQGTTTGTLPAGLSTSTDYFVVKLSASTFSLSTSLANALAGTVIDITDTGSGTHTYTPTSIAGASIKLQGSVDCTNFADIANTSTNVTATANILWNLTDQHYRCVRASSTLTAGMMTAAIYYVPTHAKR